MSHPQDLTSILRGEPRRPRQAEVQVDTPTVRAIREGVAGPPEEPAERPMARLEEAIRQSYAAPRTAREPQDAPEEPGDDDGPSWKVLGGLAAAITAATLGGAAVRRVAARARPVVPPIPPPIKASGAARQAASRMPVTHPATPEQLAAQVAHEADRNRAIGRLRSLVAPHDATSELDRSVDDILLNGPSYARQMRSVDQEVADIQESLVQHGLVKGSGRVPDSEWLRTANEAHALSRGEEFWLSRPDEVFADPRLMATAIAAQDNFRAAKRAADRSTDITLQPEEREFARRMAGEWLQRGIGAQQRVTRDTSQLARALRATQLMGSVFRGNTNNPAGWLTMAERLAGRQLDEADAGAIARLVAAGQYMDAARKLNRLRSAHPLDKVDEGLRSAMQLTLLRPFRDIVSNATNAVDFAVAGRVAGMADAVLSLFSGTREAMPPGLLTQIRVMGQGAGRGGMDALRLLARQDVAGDAEFMRRVAERMDFTNETTFTHPVTNFLATQARRWFTAADYPAYRAAFNDVLADLAMVKAYKAGWRGRDLAKHAMAIFENPGPTLPIKAQAEAVERVWQQRVPMSSAMNRWMADTTPGRRFMVRRVIPFMHTPTAMVGQALDQSPVGAIKTVADLSRFVASAFQGRPDGELQRSVARRIGMHATGLGWMAAGYMLAGNGDLEGDGLAVSGGYPAGDPREAGLMEETNAKPLSLRVNGKWYVLSMLLGPQAILLAMGAGLRRGMEALAQTEVTDPDMGGRLEQARAALTPMASETMSAIGDLPLAEGMESLGRLGRDVSRGEFGSGTGQFIGRVATQAVPAVVQQYAENADVYDDGNSVRRDTRGTDFSEALSATIREAIPGKRKELPIRTKPFGGDGTGVFVGDHPLRALAHPGRSRYESDPDPVATELARHDAFPSPTRPEPGESQAAYNERRRADGAEERAALELALQGVDEGGLEYASQASFDRWEAVGFAKPSPEYTAVLRSVTTGLRARRTRERNLP